MTGFSDFLDMEHMGQKSGFYSHIIEIVLIKWPIAPLPNPVDFLVLVLLPVAGHCWLLSFQKIIFSWPLISYPWPLWHIFLHRFLFFFLSLKCWEFFKILSLAPTLLSILPSSKLIYFFTIWILITHKYVSCRHLSSLSETYIRHLTWIIHKYPKLNISKYN